MRILSGINFELGDAIGTGGFGSVYRAFDPQLNREIAVKEIPRRQFTGFDAYFREAQMMYDARHKHVVPVLYSSRTTQNIYLAMPLMRGGSLEAVVATGPMSNRQIARFGLSLLAGLNHLHTRGLVHLDIKPANVLLDETGRAAVSDLGIAKYLSPATGTTDNNLFSGPYRQPESFSTTTLTSAADVYQIGVLLYILAVGQSAFFAQLRALGNISAVNRAIAAGAFPNRRALPPHIPPALKTLIVECMSPQPDDRPKSVLAIINRLAEVDKLLDWNPVTDGSNWSYTLTSGATVHATKGSDGRWTVSGHKGRSGRPVSQPVVRHSGLTQHRASVKARRVMEDLE